MLSGRGLCDELITRPEESYRMWCVVVCDLETNEEAMTPVGRSAMAKEKCVCVCARACVHACVYIYKTLSADIKLRVL